MLFKKAVDKELPFGIRIGSIIDFNDSGFNNAELRAENPGKSVVSEIGKMDINGIPFYRFYLQSIKGKFILQVSDIDGEYDSVIFKLLEEVIPVDEEEWSFWLNDKDGAIGWLTFETKDYASEDDMYFRSWDIPEDPEIEDPEDYVDPLETEELKYENRYDKDPKIIEHKMMLYEKEIDDELIEYILLDLIEEKDEVEIKIYVGIPLTGIVIQ